MRRLLLVGLVAGCGFQAPGGGQSLDVDAQPSIDAPGGGSPDAMVDGASGPQCPAGYLPISGLSTAAPSTYRFVTTQNTWLGAEMDCEDDAIGVATHLVVLDSSAERTAMITGHADQWIGLTDLAEEGERRYVTAQATTLSLDPTMNADNKDCVRMHNVNTDEYRACTETNTYVCECDGVAAAPSRFPNFPNGNEGGGGGGPPGPGGPGGGGP